MATLHRERGLTFHVFPNDHQPAHVHVLKDGRSFMAELTDAAKTEKRKAQIERLRAEGDASRSIQTVATSAYFDISSREVVIEFNNGAKFIFPADKGQGLQNATDEQLADIQIFPSGTALRWEDLDVDLSIPHLMEGIFGSKAWMASISDKTDTATSKNIQIGRA